MPEIPIPFFSRSRRRTRVYDANPDNLDEVVAALRESLAPTGSLQATLASSAPSSGGWLLCDGSAVSKADFPSLYAELGGTYGETDTTFTLPDLRGRMPMGIGGPGSPALGAFGGAHEITLSVSQLPSHGHALSDPGHTHAFSGTPHSHGVTDPGHGHGLTDPGHTHTINDPGHSHTGGEAAGTADSATGADTTSATFGTTGTETTGITVNSATTVATVDSGTTGVSVESATAGGTNASTTTGVTVNPTGDGAPVEIIPPAVGVNWLVRT